MSNSPASLLFIIALAGETTANAQVDCRQVCMPGETRDAAGCCVSAAADEAAPAAADTVGCLPGQRRSARSSGECCWRGQVWGGDRCRGIPSSCPTGYRRDHASESCQLKDCARGMERADDDVTCCWPGQVVHGGECRGVPSSCPPDHLVVGEGCSNEAWLEQRAEDQRQADLAAEAARDAASKEQYQRELQQYQVAQTAYEQERSWWELKRTISGTALLALGVGFVGGGAWILTSVFESLVNEHDDVTLLLTSVRLPLNQGIAAGLATALIAPGVFALISGSDELGEERSLMFCGDAPTPPAEPSEP